GRAVERQAAEPGSGSGEKLTPVGHDKPRYLSPLPPLGERAVVEFVFAPSGRKASLTSSLLPLRGRGEKPSIHVHELVARQQHTTQAGPRFRVLLRGRFARQRRPALPQVRAGRTDLVSRRWPAERHPVRPPPPP